MYFKVDPLIEINDMTISSNNVILRKVDVKPYRFDKVKLYQTKFFSILLNKIHWFYDRNGRTCKILFANDGIIRQNA